MKPTPDFALEVEGLTVSYGRGSGSAIALADLSFKIAPGEALGIVGESGSGKSTAAMAVLDLLPPGATVSGGPIHFDGEELTALSRANRRQILGARMGAVFQDPYSSLNPALRVGDQVAEPLRHRLGLSRDAARRRVVELLARTGIQNPSHVANSFPHQLSGGMRQRALIAAAISCEPALLILDEPTTALDVTVEAQILGLLADLRREQSMSVLFISHNLAVVRRICDRVLVLYAGRAMECGPSDAILANPRHPYTRGLMAAIPDLSAVRRRRLAAIPGNLPQPGTTIEGCAFAPRCAFSQPACANDDPRTIAVDATHDVTCRRVTELAGVPWSVLPVEPADPERTGDGAEEPILRAIALSKTYRLGRTWFPRRTAGQPGADATKGNWLVAHHTLTAVNGVDLTIAPGEVLGLVGESGSGKSTLGRLLLALTPPSSGRVEISDVPVAGEGATADGSWRRHAQIVFQNPESALNPRHRIGRGLRRVVAGTGLQGPAIGQRVAELLDLVGLSADHADRFPFQLSGGEKQRVSIARALATNPRFIVLDEAVSALDVSVQAMVLNLLSDLRDRLGLAYLLISHDLAVVAHMADRIAIMYRGMIVEHGPAVAVLTPPYHPYTHLLLASAPQLMHPKPTTAPLPISASTTAGCPFAGRCSWRIDGLCEQAPAPARLTERGNTLYCHRTLEELAGVADVWSPAAAAE